MVIGVTGASGHIGNNLCRALIAEGYLVRAQINNSNESLKEVPVKTITGDVTKKVDTDLLVEGCDLVIHLAAKISIHGDKDGEVRRVNVEGTRNIVNSCIQFGVKRFIHFSSIHTMNPFPLDEELNENRPYVPNGTDYDNSKIEAEKIVLKAMQSGLKANIVCPTSVFGINDFYPSLLGQAIIDLYKGKIPALPPGGYDFVNVQDIVAGTLAIIRSDINGEKYLMSGSFKTVQELAGEVSKQGQVKTTQLVLPSWFLKSLVPFFILGSKLSKKDPIFTYESLRALIESNTKISSAKAKRDLDYKVTPFDESIRETLNWFKKNGQID